MLTPTQREILNYGMNLGVSKSILKKILNKVAKYFIPKPKLKIGDWCWVTNYRSLHRPEERGQVVRVNASFDFKGVPSYFYTVKLDRISDAGNYLFLHSEDRNIWGLDEFKNK